ncbi:glycosyltransferase [Vibrio diabolicus]|uniref:Glycosyltransferase n=1 Tax=Vibrio diabolicus TaxID=50719 RepID=A0AA92LS19_9VIBR|nr:glycosyltransferase [Vibrio diabolicus]QRG82646.1 glycosyltransferase [Vibrio diabolicus]
MKNKRVLINATNLHVGGGVQVAASFIDELSKVRLHDQVELTVLCSSKVNENLSSTTDIGAFDSFKVIDIYGYKSPNKEVLSLFLGFHTVFTVFGPIYFQLDCNHHVCGFAQPWICFGNNKTFGLLPVKERLLSKLKFFLQKVYFRKADSLVVETISVKESLHNKSIYNKPIYVVDNCVSSTLPKLELVDAINEKREITLGFIGRPYAHKNLKILNEVSDLLEKISNTKYRFLFTLNEGEMKSLGFDTRENFSTLGALSIEECSRFYESIDGLIFPSLLECFSASPLEAMHFGKPVFCSNLDFVSSICKDNVFYFDPWDALSIANTVELGFSDLKVLNEKVEQAHEYVSGLPTAKDRSNSYISIILQKTIKDS